MPNEVIFLSNSVIVRVDRSLCGRKPKFTFREYLPRVDVFVNI